MTALVVAWVVFGLCFGFFATNSEWFRDSFNDPPVPIVRGLIVVASVVLAPIAAVGCALWLLGHLTPGRRLWK